MANNDTDVNVNIGAKNEAKSVLSGAISDFQNFWKTARGDADSKAAAGNFETLAGKLGVSNRAMLAGGVAGGVLAAGAIAAGVSAAKAATNFQELTTQLVTGAGESEKNMNMIRQGIMNISSATGDSATQLAQGMFLIESAGYHGAAGLNVARVAAEGAKVGGADLATTSDALTTVMHDYGISANDSAQAMNFLTSTVANGKMHMEDLSGSMGKVLPTAASLHVPLYQVGAAIAALTSAGVPAARATTAINQTMLQLVKPSKAAQTAMESVGLSSIQVGDTLTHQGLQPALQLITDAVGKKFPAGSAQYLEAIATIGGGTKSLTGILGTTGTNMSTFIANVNDIADKTKKAGNSVMGWNEVQKDEKTKLDQAKESINNAKIALGEGLLPAVAAITQAIVRIVTPIAEWIAGHQKLAAIILGAVAAFGAFIASTLLIAKAIGAVRLAFELLGKSFLTNPIGLIIMILIGLTIMLVQHWNTVKQWFSRFWSDLKQWFDDGVNWIKHHWELLAVIIMAPVAPILAVWYFFHNQIIAAFRDVVNAVSGAWNGLVGFIKGAVSGFGRLLISAGSDLIGGLVRGIEGAAGRVFDTVRNIGSKAVGALKGVLKILSPSQVFADIGTNIGAGLVQGIKGTEVSVTQATTKLGTAAIVGGNTATAAPSISNSVSHNSNTSQNITIQQVVLQMPNGATMQTFIDSLNQDQLNVSRGLSPVQGAYGVR